MRNVSDISCREKQNTHFLFGSFLSESRALYQIMWKNMAVPDRSQMEMQWGACAFFAGFIRQEQRNKRLISPITGLEWPRGFQVSKVPRFHEKFQ
jgi:hypothetical protein